MSKFQRFAVYYIPEHAPLAAFGAAWLGWDIETGTWGSSFDVPGLADIVAAPRKYGFHGTLKPPFRLAQGHDVRDLEAAIAALASRTPALLVDRMTVAEVGHFLALVPHGDMKALERLAFACVTELDGFRAPATAAEMTRRRATGLTARQDELLMAWGYPYVDEEFRFHMTLSGKLSAADLDQARAMAAAHLPALPEPFDIRSISLVGERRDGMFELIHRYALTG